MVIVEGGFESMRKWWKFFLKFDHFLILQRSTSKIFIFLDFFDHLKIPKNEIFWSCNFSGELKNSQNFNIFFHHFLIDLNFYILESRPSPYDPLISFYLKSTSPLQLEVLGQYSLKRGMIKERRLLSNL